MRQDQHTTHTPHSPRGYMALQFGNVASKPKSHCLELGHSIRSLFLVLQPHITGFPNRHHCIKRPQLFYSGFCVREPHVNQGTHTDVLFWYSLNNAARSGRASMRASVSRVTPTMHSELNNAPTSAQGWPTFTANTPSDHHHNCSPK